MQERVMKWLRGLLDKWKALTKKQKTQMIAIAAILLAIIVFTAWLTLRPTMDVVYTASSTQDAARIRSALTTGGISSSIDQNGTRVLVNHNDYYDALVYIEENNVITDPGFTYQNAIDFSGIGATDTVISENFRKAAETDIANKITRLRNILDCTVTLVVPGSSNYYMAQQEKASAMVIVTTSSKLDTRQGEVIARLVSRSVKNLDIKDIEVVDSDMYTLYSGYMSMEGDVTNQTEAEALMADRLEAQVKKVLRPQFSEVLVMSNLVFDWDKLVEETVTYSLPGDLEGDKGFIDRSQTTSSSYQGGAQDAEPGLGANDNTLPTYQSNTGTEASSNSKTADTNYLYNVVNAIKDAQIGKFLKGNSSLSVYLYNYIVYDEADIRERNLLDGISWADFKATNSAPVAFDVDGRIVQSIVTGTGIQDITVVGYSLPRFNDEQVAPVRIAEFISYGVVILLILLLAYALLRRTQPDVVTEIEPTLTVEEMLVSTKQEEIEQSEAEKLREIEFGIESEVRKQINKFVQEKPDAVAQLLRNWISEDWE